MIAILLAFLTYVMWNALSQMTLFNTAAPVRTVGRGTQSELNPVIRQACIVLREVNAVTRQGSAMGCSTCG